MMLLVPHRIGALSPHSSGCLFLQHTKPDPLQQHLQGHQKLSVRMNNAHATTTGVSCAVGPLLFESPSAVDCSTRPRHNTKQPLHQQAECRQR